MDGVFPEFVRQKSRCLSIIACLLDVSGVVESQTQQHVRKNITRPCGTGHTVTGPACRWVSVWSRPFLCTSAITDHHSGDPTHAWMVTSYSFICVTFVRVKSKTTFDVFVARLQLFVLITSFVVFYMYININIANVTVYFRQQLYRILVYFIKQ